MIEIEPSAAGGGERFRRELERVRPQLGAVFDSTALAVTGPLAPELPVLFWALGSLPRGGGVLSIRRRYLKTSDAVLVSCTADLAILERMLGGTGPSGELVPWGLDAERFRPAPPRTRADLRRSLGLHEEAFLLVFTGRINVQKNLHSLLYLAAELRPLVPQVEIVLMGEEDRIPLRVFGVRNEGYLEELRALAQRLGLADRVRFLGAVGDERLIEVLTASDVFVSLSVHQDENFGYAPIEAMACGIPAVVTDWGGYRDSVVHGETGFRVPTWLTEDGVRAAWRRAIPHLVRLAREPELRLRLGQAARVRAVSAFSEPVFAAALAAAVRRAFGRRGPAPTGDRAFRFHPAALKLQARNALRHLAHERGERLDRTYAAEDLPSYRFFIEPYATADVAAVTSAPEDRPTALVELRVEGSRVESLDPIWPGVLDLEPDHARALLASGGGTIAGRAALAGIEVTASLLDAASRLARAGFIDLGRPSALDLAAS